jgi:benzaldehyde dehydrogenase (NAD)
VTGTGKVRTYGPFIAGAALAGGERPEITVHDKATGEIIGIVAVALESDCREAVARAANAQEAWEATPVTERARILNRAAEILQSRTPELVDMLIRESGGSRGKASGEWAASIGELPLAGGLALAAEGSIVPSGQSGRVNLIERRAVGVLALITGSNYPTHLAFRILAPALALGNAVVLKPASLTPLSGGVAWADAFAEAGLPPGTLSVLPGMAAGPILVSSPDVDMIHFTGSTEVGLGIAQEAAKSLKKVGLELGGNNATIVLSDADVELAAEKGAIATYVHQGQVCIATSRHIVVRAVLEDYTAALRRHAEAIVMGDPFAADAEFGPLVSASLADSISAMVGEATAAGAKVVLGGTNDGPFMAPTILTGVTPGMALFDEEPFGPVASIIVAEDEADAIRLANLSRFGLSAAIFTRDVARGWTIARRIKAGMVHVNDMTALHESHVPFGGIGASGAGEMFGGRASIDLLTERRWISLQIDESSTNRKDVLA